MVKKEFKIWLEKDTIKKFDQLARAEGFNGKGHLRSFIEKLTTQEFFFRTNNLARFLNSYEIEIKEIDSHEIKES